MANRLQIGDVQIFLAQVHTVSVMLNRQLPVVIDKQTRLVSMAQRNRLLDSGFYFLCLTILNAQL